MLLLGLVILEVLTNSSINVLFEGEFSYKQGSWCICGGAGFRLGLFQHKRSPACSSDGQLDVLLSKSLCFTVTD